MLRYEDIPVEATGSDVPAAIESFADVSSTDKFLTISNFCKMICRVKIGANYAKSASLSGVNDSSDERKH